MIFFINYNYNETVEIVLHLSDPSVVMHQSLKRNANKFLLKF